jgi:uncharacterized protein (TIGR02145 family)
MYCYYQISIIFVKKNNMKISLIIFLFTMVLFSCKKEKKEESNKPIIEEPELTDINDIEGNNYKTVKIGDQIWMAENLKTTKYSNGVQIAVVTNEVDWANTLSGAVCYFDNNSTYQNPHGMLYNAYVIDTVLNVCPTGWHLPSKDEFTILSDYLGGEFVAGSKMKSSTAIFKPFFVANGTNSSGFNGLPSGSRYIDGNFALKDSFGLFWSSTDFSSIKMNYVSLSSEDNLQFSSALNNNGFSIRCIKD